MDEFVVRGSKNIVYKLYVNIERNIDQIVWVWVC